MVCTAQTANPPIMGLCKSEFLDHTGQTAVRVAMLCKDDPFPPDFNLAQHFAFQIYSTIPLSEVGDEGERRDQDPYGQILSYFSADDPPQGCAYPIFEIYAQQQDALACVHHQRGEIAHRKAAQSDGKGTLLIPKLVLGEFDRRRAGFLMVIASETYKDGNYRGEVPDPDGPLWVWFDRHQGSSASVPLISRIATGHEATDYGMGASPDSMSILPERMEVLVQRKQEVDQMTSLLYTLWRKSLCSERKAEYALEDEGRQKSNQGESGALELISREAQLLALDDYEMKEEQGVVTISSVGLAAEPDLRYSVYVAFESNSSGELESTGRAFSSAITSRLPQSTTFSFEFRRPLDPALSSILAAHRAVAATRPGEWTGALVKVQATDQPRTWNGKRGDDDSRSSTQRLYPCTREEKLPFDLGFEPYRTFIVVLDRASFIAEPGVLLLLADGGKIIPDADWDSESYGPAVEDFDNVETHVWRSAGMDEVARRLAMIVPQQEESQT